MIRMLGSENRQDYVHCRHWIQGRNLITQKTNEQVSSLISSLLEVCPGAILFKSMEGLGIPTKKNKKRKHY